MKTEADDIWHRSNDTRFGLRSPTNLELQQQIDDLQQLLAQRENASVIPEDKRATGDMAEWRQPIAKAMISRISRQGVKTTTKNDKYDKNDKIDISKNNQKIKAFVVFNDPIGAYMINDLYRNYIFSYKYDDQIFNNNRLKIKMAPEPNTIICE